MFIEFGCRKLPKNAWVLRKRESKINWRSIYREVFKVKEILRKVNRKDNKKIVIFKEVKGFLLEIF